MRQIIENRFELNLERVRNLVSIYRNHLSGAGGGRRGHQTTDVLRAATVLLHAALEDVLRSLAYWKLPQTNAAVLESIPLVGGSATKFNLGSLAVHRGKTIDEVIKESTDASLERSNYNNRREVLNLLASIGLNAAPLQQYMAALEETMLRRHQIVHRADANSNPRPGRGNHRVATIAPGKLNGWITNTEKFVQAVLTQV